MMNFLLIAAAFLIVFIAFAHSWLGEKYIIRRLLKRRELPELFGSDLFTRQTIRFGWHLTTIAWLGLAHILAVISGFYTEYSQIRSILFAVGFTFFASAVLSLIFTRGRHLSWIIFFIVALFCFIQVV